jgi:manganese/zinc/iron transport system substrate-binding protein
MRSLQGIALLLLIAVLWGCSPSENPHNGVSQEKQKWREHNGKVKVLSTIAMIHDLVKQVGGDYVDAIALIQGEMDPHSYQLVKGDDEKFAYADLIFFNGLGLEHGPSLQQFLSTSPKAIPLGDRILKTFPEQILRYHQQTDPHIWMDISLWARTVPFIVEALTTVDPVHREAYEANGRQLQKALTEAHQQIFQQMMALPEQQRYLVTSHDAFTYFARAYLATEEERAQGGWEKRFAAPEGLAPESQLSTTDIQFILDHVKKYQICVLFPESNVSKDSIRKIVSAGKEKGLSLYIASDALYGDAMGRAGSDGDSYLKMAQHNADAMRKEWGEECRDERK